MILNGAVQDELDASIAGLASRRRMDNRRENRVWLYFQPDPAPPLLAVPEKLKIDFPKWAIFVLGGLAALWGLVEVIGFITGPTATEPGAAMWLSLLLLLGGGFLFVWFRIQAKVAALRRGVREARGLQDLGDAVDDAEPETDHPLVAAQPPDVRPEDDQHQHRGDREAHREEVRGRDRRDEVADEEERRAPHRGEEHEQAGGDGPRPRRGEGHLRRWSG
jgi:hypothetical protein